jgi:hypothetical protein
VPVNLVRATVSEGRTLLESWGVVRDGAGGQWAQALGFRRVHSNVLQVLVLADVDRSLWQVDTPTGYRAERWIGPRSAGPAGNVTATVTDVLASARLQPRAGLARTGARVLAEGTIAAMQQPQVAVPNPYGARGPMGHRLGPRRLGRRRRVRARRDDDRAAGPTPGCRAAGSAGGSGRGSKK